MARDRRRHLARGLLLGAAAIAAVTAVVAALQHLLPLDALAGLYVLTILPIATGWGFGPALLVAIASTLTFDFFFTPPRYVLDATDLQTLTGLVVSAVTAYVVSVLAGRAQRRAREAEALAVDIRDARDELRRIADEQAALRRVATLVARGAPPEQVFAAVTDEVAHLLPADAAAMARYDPAGWVTQVGGVTADGGGTTARTPLGGRTVAALVAETGRPARIDDRSAARGLPAGAGRPRPVRSSVGVPISIEDRLWGVMTVTSVREEPLPADTEARLAGFTELVATAVAAAQAHVDLRGYADEQSALRRVATLVARPAPPAAVFAAVTEEVARLIPADLAVLGRYEADGTVTGVGYWSASGDTGTAGPRAPFGGREVSSLVFRSGRPARIDRSADAAGARERGSGSSVGAPIHVEGRLWGVVVISSRIDGPLPADTEARLVAFTELVATAIANAENQAALTASRARIVATADSTRRRIERDLHDGAQQRLVSLALELRAARATVPPAAAELARRLDGVARELTGVLEELREIARGIHPAVLVQGGLRPALKALARRSAVPVRLDVRVGGRLPEPVEVAAYYVVSEALTNAAKHADASVVHVEAHEDGGVLRARVRDDGRGGARFADGSGLAGLRDRVEAIGGRLSLHADAPGTVVEVELPLAPVDAIAG